MDDLVAKSLNNITLVLIHVIYLLIVFSNFSSRKCSCYVKNFICERHNKQYLFRAILNIFIGFLLVIEDVLLIKIFA